MFASQFAQTFGVQFDQNGALAVVLKMGIAEIDHDLGLGCQGCGGVKRVIVRERDA